MPRVGGGGIKQRWLQRLHVCVHVQMYMNVHFSV